MRISTLMAIAVFVIHSSAFGDSSFQLDADHSDRIYHEGETATFSVTLLTEFTGPDGPQEAVVHADVNGTRVGGVQGSDKQFSFASSPFTSFQIGAGTFNAAVLIRSKDRSDSIRDAIDRATNEKNFYIADCASTTDLDRQAYDKTKIEQLDKTIDMFIRQLETSLVPVGTQTLNFTVRPSNRNITLARTGANQTLDIASQITSPSGTPMTIVDVSGGSRGSVAVTNGVITYAPDTTRLFNVTQVDLGPGQTQPDQSALFWTLDSTYSDLVFFASTASDLVLSNPQNNAQTYVFDPHNGKLSLEGLTYNGALPNNWNQIDSISQNGLLETLENSAPNMIPSAPTSNEIYVRNRVTGDVTLISGGPGGVPGDNTSQSGVISPDGTRVVFSSSSTNLDLPNISGHYQIFERDLTTGKLTLISHDASGAPGNGDSSFPTVSAEGRYIAYYSTANNLVTGLSGTLDEVYLYDSWKKSTQLISRGIDEQEANGAGASFPFISLTMSNLKFMSDGSGIMYGSNASNLVAGPSTGHYQPYFYDLTSGTTSRYISAYDGTELNADAGFFHLTPNLRYSSLITAATNVLQGSIDSDGVPHCYFIDRQLNKTVRVDVNAQGQPANGTCFSEVISPDGLYAVIVDQFSTNLYPGNGGALANVFVVTKSDQFSYSAKDSFGNFVTGRVTLTDPLIGTTKAPLKGILQ